MLVYGAAASDCGVTESKLTKPRFASVAVPRGTIWRSTSVSCSHQTSPSPTSWPDSASQSHVPLIAVCPWDTIVAFGGGVVVVVVDVVLPLPRRSSHTTTPMIASSTTPAITKIHQYFFHHGTGGAGSVTSNDTDGPSVKSSSGFTSDTA